MSFYSQGQRPHRRRHGIQGCGCGCAALVLGGFFVFVVTSAIIAFILAMTPDGPTGTEPTSPPTSTGGEWQPSGG